MAKDLLSAGGEGNKPGRFYFVYVYSFDSVHVFVRDLVLGPRSTSVGSESVLMIGDFCSFCMFFCCNVHFMRIELGSIFFSFPQACFFTIGFSFFLARCATRLKPRGTKGGLNVECICKRGIWLTWQSSIPLDLFLLLGRSLECHVSSKLIMRPA